jgi:hypothetical protein
MTSTIKVDNIQNQCGANIINESSNTITLGASGDTVALASGASQSGFGRTGTVDWQTTIKTANFTAADGEGYFVDTNSSGITATLPAGSAGAIVAFKDYRNTFDSNALIVSPNGSDKIGGVNANVTFATEAQSVTLIYTDSTRGWIDIHDSTTAAEGNAYIVASGGTETTCGVYKIHTFTAPGTFTVSGAASAPADNAVSYLVVGGGGGGSGQYYGGGGGAGGFRFANTTCMPAPQSSPLAAPAGQTVSVQAYPITVGAGGATTNCAPGVVGGNSIFGTITAAGGGFGADADTPGCGGAGGSGGGGGGTFSGGAGNTPSVSPSQGNNGGNGGTSPQGPQGNSGGGGGGASTAGVNSTNGAPQCGNSGTAGNGGDGSYVVSAGFAGCNGAPGPVSGARHFSGGGGGGSNSTGGPNGAGGEGGGGRGAPSATAGSTNTGGGGGSGSHAGNPPSQGAAGGSGIVIIRYKFQAS